MQLYVRACHVVGAETAVDMAVPIENSVDCEVRDVIRFLQADEILGYLAEEASSRVELFCYTSAYCPADKPSCMSDSIGTFSIILHRVRTWHRRTFSCFQKMKENVAGKRYANIEDLNNSVGAHMV